MIKSTKTSSSLAPTLPAKTYTFSAFPSTSAASPKPWLKGEMSEGKVKIARREEAHAAANVLGPAPSFYTSTNIVCVGAGIAMRILVRPPDG